jgi:YidC/Oxa1 family membrane protein insertase
MKISVSCTDQGRLRRLALVLAAVLMSPWAAANTRVVTDQLELSFDGAGNLDRVTACLPSCGAADAKSRSFGGGGPVFAPGRRLEGQYMLERRDLEDRVELDFVHSATGAVKAWTVPASGWRLQLRTRGLAEAILASGVDFRPPPAAGFGEWLEQVRYTWFDGSSVHKAALDENSTELAPVSEWFGYRSRYWAALALPAEPLRLSRQHGEAARDAAIHLEWDGGAPQDLSLYFGPVEPAALGSAAPELKSLMYASLWMPLRWICQALFFLLGAIHMLIPHWAGAIVLLSVTVAFLMRPLSRIADRLQDDVHRIEARLAPRLRQIKSESKGEEQAERILALYKAEGVNPLYSLKSLVGVMVVIPVFIGAFDMLAENIWLSGEPFLWINDLSRPDSVISLPFSMGFFGNQLNVLPFLMTGLSVWASSLHRHEAMDTEQHRKHLQKLVLMAVAFLLLFYTFPAGMVLYWATNNLVSVIRNYYRRFRAAPAPE